MRSEINRQCPVLAIVVPAFNESPNVAATVSELTSVIQSLIAQAQISTESFIVFVDDGSRDGTWEALLTEKANNKLLHAIKLSRNFGHQNALLAGYLSLLGRCDCVISIDADLQQDPHAIPEFIQKFKAGADLVLGIRKDRAVDSWFKRTSGLFFYRLMNLMGARVVENHADYRLISQVVLQKLSLYSEVNLFLRGLIHELGFKVDYCYFHTKAREHGETKYPLSRMIGFALDGITSFSIKPLRFLVFLGGAIFLISMMLTLYIFFHKITGHTEVPGWASIILPIYFIGGIQILSIGVVGEYVGKIYKESKRRPLYITEDEF